MAGMIVPKFWAEGRLRERRKSGQVTVRRWGWSDESQEKAQAHADLRTKEALQRILAGEAIDRREPKVPYNGAEGIPIREEILSQHGETVITRNAYGAHCLNTPDVLFADVDLGDPPVPCWPLLGPALAAGVAGLGLGAPHRVMVGIAAFLGTLALMSFGWKLVRRTARALAGGAEKQARDRIDRFVKTHPGCLLRIYRTPAGFRVLAQHRLFDPSSPEALELFDDLDCDPIYVRMCVKQHCFRARVSPKPWRIGLSRHMKPSPGVWPVDPSRKAKRAEWVATYEEASLGYASCRYLTTLGDGKEAAEVVPVRELHDTLSRALGSLPIA